MKPKSFWTISAALIMALGMLSACSSKKSGPPSNRKSQDECKTSTKDKKKSNLVGGEFGLIATSYDDVKDIIDEHCIACHGKGGGLGNLDLSSYSALTKAADAVISVVESDGDDVMPPAPADALSTSDIKTLKAWIKDGKKEDAEASTDDESEAGEDDPCGSDQPGDDDDDDKDEGDDDTDDLEQEEDENKFKIDPELYELYIEPAEMKDCHTAGKAYLRNGTEADSTPRCDDTNYPAKFTCDEAGVLAAFNNNAQVIAEMAAKKAEGYIIDQCAEANSKPVVYLVCFSGDDDQCVAPASLETETLTIKASKIAME